jgi:hypothetical protein
MARFEAMCGNNFDLGSSLDFEKMQRPLNDQERTIIKRRQQWLDGVMANQHKTRQKQILWKGCRRWRVVVACLKRSAAS